METQTLTTLPRAPEAGGAPAPLALCPHRIGIYSKGSVTQGLHAQALHL